MLLKLAYVWITLVVPVPRAFADETCQLPTERNQSLPSVLRISCNSSNISLTCNCTSTWTNLSWKFANKDMVKQIHSAPEGTFYLTDSSGKCVGSWATGFHPVSCVPGFYCPGGANPPYSCGNGDYCPGHTGSGYKLCPRGMFCPTASVKMPCPSGVYCPPGCHYPDVCTEGYYCSATEKKICPQGNYCPYGSSNYTKCRMFASCDAGSSYEDVRLFSFVCLFIFSIFCGMLMKFYDKISETRWVGFGICSLLVAIFWIVDRPIAFALTTLFVMMVLNYAFLSFDTCSTQASRILIVCTSVAALGICWQITPTTALFIFGICICFVVGWLMFRHHAKIAFIGRVLFGCAFIFILCLFWAVDPSVALVFTLSIVFSFLGIVIAWLFERFRSQNTSSLPGFITRWGQVQEEDGEGSPTGTTSAVAFLRENRGDLERSQAAKPTGVTNPVPKALPPDISGPSADSTASVTSLDSEGEKEVRGVSFNLEEVSFSLPDGRQLLQKISFDVCPGRRVAVMGPSGSGKSTLLAVLSGRASYGETSGELLISGERDLAFARGITGFVPQDDIMHGELTVWQNIWFNAALRLPAGTPLTEIDRITQKVADDLQIGHVLQNRVGTPEKRGISGGQRKRVSIAMELVTRPVLLFADEPTSGLDSTTSFEVVRCLNDAAKNLGTTVLTVIHQPRYELLCLFDDLILLGSGGYLVYAGPTRDCKEYFSKRLNVAFPQNTNPADVFLDVTIQSNPAQLADSWTRHLLLEQAHASISSSASSRNCRFPKPRDRTPFVKATMLIMHRANLQCCASWPQVLFNQLLICMATYVICSVIEYNRIQDFMMQAAFAILFLMLLQGVAAQRVFGGPERLIALREAGVSMPMFAYFVGKDIAALFEVTLAAGIFTAMYFAWSHVQMQIISLFAGTWAFVYAVFGVNYLFSVCFSPASAQMSAVVISFVAFCFSGVYEPGLQDLSAYVSGRGWVVPALSPIRWLWGYMLTAEAEHLAPVVRKYSAGPIRDKGYDLDLLEKRCSLGMSLQEAWLNGGGWVCSTKHLLLLGLMFRFLAAVCLLLYVFAHSSGWSRFAGSSDAGVWKHVNNFFLLLLMAYLMMFLIAEVWVMGLDDIKVGDFLNWFGKL